MDESAATQAFGRFIRTLRERRGFKQAELAELSDVSTPYISQVEMGKRIPTIKVCLQLAEALNYDPRDLILEAMALKTPAIAEVIYRGDTDSNGAHRLLAEEQLQNLRAAVASFDNAPLREPSQGKSPQNVFTDLYPLIHAAETPVSGSYARAAQVSATLAEAYAGIAGKTVLDLGCGYGNTALALAAYGPQEIVAVDSSPHMIDLLKRVLLSKVSIRLWLRSIQAPDLLGELYAPTLAHLTWMRHAFERGTFRRKEGILRPLVRDGLTLDIQEIGPVDLLVANNYLHWAVNRRIDQLHTEHGGCPDGDILIQACHDALLPMASVLREGGIAIIMEPIDFVQIDDNLERNEDLRRHSALEHPAFLKYQEMVNHILKEKYGIERKVPEPDPLFFTSKLGTLVEGCDFSSPKIHQLEWALASDPVDHCFVRLPLLLGTIDLPFEEKLAIGRLARKEVAKLLTDEEAELPMRTVWFFFVLERRSGPHMAQARLH